MRKVLIILGVPIDDLTMPEALDRIDAFVSDGRAAGTGRQIATINADFVVKSMSDPELRRILQDCDMATADGMPLVWGARLLGVPLTGRVTGADMVPALAERAARNGYSIYFLGAAPGVAQRAADVLAARYPGLKVAGVLSPSNRSMIELAEKGNDADIVQAVRAAQPDILLVAFGNPKQEKWINLHLRELRDLRAPVMIGVGGTFDFLAGVTRRAPGWMQRAGLEWVYRLAQEPRRLWKRYVVDMLGFGAFFARQWWAMRQGRVPAPAVPLSDAVLIGGAAVLNVQGRLDAAVAADFDLRASQALEHTPRLVVNLARASFIDSRGIGCLVALAKRAREAGGDLLLAAAPEPIAKILALTRLDLFFKSVADVDAGLTQFQALAHPPGAAPAEAPEKTPVEAPAQADARPAPAGWAVLKMPRQMDAVSSPPVIELGEAELTGHARLVLDFTDTAYVSSAGLAAIARLAREAKARSLELRLAGCAGDVMRTLQLVRFDKMIPIYPSVASATRM